MNAASAFILQNVELIDMNIYGTESGVVYFCGRYGTESGVVYFCGRYERVILFDLKACNEYILQIAIFHCMLSVS